MTNPNLPYRAFPQTRMRRNRTDDSIRRLVRENHLMPSDLIYPIFVTEGQNIQDPIASMAGIHRISLDILAKQVKEIYALGIPAIALFPHIDARLKDEIGSLAYRNDNLICRAIKTVKQAQPELMVICDVALDPLYKPWS